MLNSAAWKELVNDTVVDSYNGTLGASATLQIIDGSMPATCEDATVGTVLVSIAIDPTTPVIVGTGGSNDFTTLPPTTITNSGTAAYWRIFDSSSNCVQQGDVGTGGGDINFTSLTFTASDTCTITFLALTIAVTP
ncbi:MAG: hypothetical protein [Circular genetic element sp.]|nr:MAG: hypothetical protein [Circular genetic element sp.]